MSNHEGRRIGHVQRIFDIPGQIIESERDITRLIETPLRNAVRILVFNKNIQPFSSTANSKRPFAIILIQPEVLTSQNLAIARKNAWFVDDAGPYVSIDYAINRLTPEADVNDYFVAAVSQFEAQSR